MRNISTNGKFNVERKNTITIIDNIFKVLQDREIHTINNVSYHAKSHWKTIKNYIDIIIKIQEMPKIEVLKTSKHTLVRLI